MTLDCGMHRLAELYKLSAHATAEIADKTDIQEGFSKKEASK